MMLEKKLAEMLIQNGNLKVEVDTIRKKNKELTDCSNEFQKLNILLQRDAIRNIKEMRSMHFF